MSTLKQITWGYVFLFVDIRINSFDILPDWLGLLLIVFGCAKAAERSGIKEFRGAQQAAAIYFLFNLLTFIINMNTGASPTIQAGDQLEYNSTMLLILVGQLIHLSLVFCLCRSVYAYAVKQKASELQSSAAIRWKVYLVCTTLYLVYFAFLPNIGGDYVSPIIFAAVIGFILEIFILLLLISAVKHPYKEEPSSNADQPF